jgi:hypothetical protein
VTRPYEPLGATQPYQPAEPNLSASKGGPGDDQGIVSSSTSRRTSAARTPDPTSIGAGIVFFAFGAAYLLASSGHLAVNGAWSASLLLVGLGLAGLLGGTLRSRRRR